MLRFKRPQLYDVTPWAGDARLLYDGRTLRTVIFNDGEELREAQAADLANISLSMLYSPHTNGLEDVAYLDLPVGLMCARHRVHRASHTACCMAIRPRAAALLLRSALWGLLCGAPGRMWLRATWLCASCSLPLPRVPLPTGALLTRFACAAACRVVGRYRVEAHIGTGCFSRVVRGYDLCESRSVSIKVCSNVWRTPCPRR